MLLKGIGIIAQKVTPSIPRLTNYHTQLMDLRAPSIFRLKFCLRFRGITLAFYRYIQRYPHRFCSFSKILFLQFLRCRFRCFRTWIPIISPSQTKLAIRTTTRRNDEKQVRKRLVSLGSTTHRLPYFRFQDPMEPLAAAMTVFRFLLSLPKRKRKICFRLFLYNNCYFDVIKILFRKLVFLTNRVQFVIPASGSFFPPLSNAKEAPKVL